MKLKELLFQKVNKDTLKKDSVQRAIKLTICGAFIFALIFQLVACLYAPMSAYAAVPGDTQSTMILKAGTYRFNDVLTITDGHNKTLLNFTYNGVQCYEINVGYTDGEVSGNFLYDEYSSLEFYGSDGAYYMIYANGSISQNNEILVQGTGYQVDTPVDIIITADTEVDDTFGTWFISNTNYNEVNEPSITCPTLPELLADYTGSFDSIVDMLNSRNYQEYEDFVHGLEQDAFDRGASSGFGENVLGSAFNAPLTALNQWVLFETSTGLEVTMGGVFTGLIALSILIILLKMFSGG